MRAASAADSEICLLVSVYQNLGESKSQTKFKNCITRRGVRISVFFAMGDYQSARFGGILEPSVMVCIAATAILYSHNKIEVMNHFVKKCCNNLFDRSCKRSGSDVYFVRSAKL